MVANRMYITFVYPLKFKIKIKISNFFYYIYILNVLKLITK